MAFTYTGEQVDLGFGRGWLSRPAAASIRRVDRQIGHPLQITEAGRTRARQMEHWLTYQRVGRPIALHPDTPSEHQKGLSIDSDEAQRIIAILEDHGWRRTVYRWVNGRWTLVEPWHFEYFAHLDNHRNDPEPTAPQEDDMSQQSVRAPSGKIYAMATSSIVHMKKPSTAKITTAVNSTKDETHNVTLPEFAELLDGMFIPRDVLDIHGNVLNPETGRFEEGGAWSYARANKAANDKIRAEQAEQAKRDAAIRAEQEEQAKRDAALKAQLDRIEKSFGALSKKING